MGERLAAAAEEDRRRFGKAVEAGDESVEETCGLCFDRLVGARNDDGASGGRVLMPVE